MKYLPFAFAFLFISMSFVSTKIFAQVQVVQCGDMISSVFTSDGQVHEYQIQMDAGMRLFILAEPTPGNYQNLRLDFGIYAPSGFEIDELEPSWRIESFHSNYRPKHNTAPLSETGLYTINIAGVTSTGSTYNIYFGCMSLKGQVITSDYSSANLSCGDIFDNEIEHSYEIHDYYIELSQGDQVIISAVSTSTQYQELRFDTGIASPSGYVIDELDPEWRIEDFTNNNSTEIATSSLSETGIYNLWLRALSANGGSFTITVGCTLADGTVIRPGEYYQPTTTVTVVGSFQSEVGCLRTQGIGGDWAPECNLSELTDSDGDGKYTWITSAIPQGNWEAKITINGSWDENYGLDGVRDGSNISFNIPNDGAIMSFEYNSATHLVTVTTGSAETVPNTVPQLIVTAPGSYQSEIGCRGGQLGGDWNPDCDFSLLTDDDNDGIYTWTSTEIPSGIWEMKIAINRNWEENYGEDGELDGNNITFQVASDYQRVTFEYNSSSHEITVSVGD